SRRARAAHGHRIETGNATPALWPPLHRLWADLVLAQANMPDTADEPALRALILSLGKLTRNLAADVASNQNRVFAVEPHIRNLVRVYTAWTRENDAASYTVTRMLTQALSNIVTGNNDLQRKLWADYMALPEEQSILIRLLASPDTQTVISVLVLCINCIRGDAQRGLLLCTTTTGVRLCVSLLDTLEKYLDFPESDDEGKVFELGYAVMCALFEQGHFAELFRRMSMEDEAVAPPQMTLLKLLDSSLHASDSRGRRSAERRDLVVFLASSLFFSLSGYAQHAIRQAISALPAPAGNASPHEIEIHTEPHGAGGALDLQLPGVCAALVLLAQCLVTILLAEEDEQQHAGVADAAGPAPRVTVTLKATVSESRSSEGFVERLLETLRLLDVFLPRIQFGKAAPAARDAGGGAGQGVGVGSAARADATGFAYLKRDLVRLLGVLCHDSRGTQDRVRLCQGIPVVLNLCVIDERNPYLREHALFALRNILHHNADNQAVVDAIRPMGTWDEDGVLRDTPGAVRR
ncbi:hypothetical protein FA95DRAFT_1501960, partial [Auriscalpium vulgare]